MKQRNYMGTTGKAWPIESGVGKVGFGQQVFEAIVFWVGSCNCRLELTGDLMRRKTSAHTSGLWVSPLRRGSSGGGFVDRSMVNSPFRPRSYYLPSPKIGQKLQSACFGDNRTEDNSRMVSAHQIY